MEDINNMDTLQSTRGNRSIRKIALVRKYKTIIKLTAYNGRTKLGSIGIEIFSENKFIFRGKLVTE